MVQYEYETNTITIEIATSANNSLTNA